ncbi:MAG: TRAP transporter large permease subunit [Hyphomicrobiaceae bacterium]|nr:TRAP transporter large permease subunit [Hyphomicrobiaceae bacterium]
MTTAVLFISLFVCMFIGMPIALALGFSSVITILFFSSDSLATIALKMMANVSEYYTLLAIPFFILSSQFLSTGGVPARPKPPLSLLSTPSSSPFSAIVISAH